MTKLERCILCGAEKDEGMRDCGKHTYEEYQKAKNKMWNDPWPYFPIGFGGFWIMTYVVSILFLQDWSLEKVGQNISWLLVICFGVPVICCFILHNYRQKKKGLPFWGLTNEQEVERNLSK